MFNYCFKNGRNFTQKEVGNQQVTYSQNKFLAIVSGLIESYAAALFKMLFGSRPVNHILVSEQKTVR